MSHADLSLPSIEAAPQRPTQLALIRHGEVEAAYQRVFGGRIDMNLSPRGHEQAAALAKWLARQPLNAVYASPMKRVQQTLAPFAANNGWTDRVAIMNDLREIDFGDWTGLTWEAVAQKFGVSAFQWLTELERGGIANAENTQAYRDRIEPCVRDILQKHSGENVAVFCHGGVIRMILTILLDIPLPRMAGFEIDYASVTNIAVLPQKTEVQFLNFTPWDEPGL
ncbi:MAG TPA: histidine phosphatase family protein [Verrucomicrobiae bacterium]|jgi:broad specificity phosphatase PhoE|nr:histidine phosphatase family protein [Verrucomicrobiae bacterium]